MSVELLSEPVAHAVVMLAVPRGKKRPAEALDAEVHARRRGEWPSRVVVQLDEWDDEPAATILELADALRAYWAELEMAGGELMIVAEAESRLASLLVDLPVVDSAAEAVALFEETERMRETERLRHVRVHAKRGDDSATPAPAETPALAESKKPADDVEEPAATPTTEPSHPSSSSNSSNNSKVDVDVNAAAAAAADAPPTGTLQRKATVHYYQRMNQFRTVTLHMRFTRDDVVPAAGAQERRRTVLTVVPQIPGCVVMPERLDVDVSRDKVEVQFFVTPLALGEVAPARIEIWEAGHRLEVIAVPTDVRTQGLTRAALVAALVVPFLLALLDGFVAPAEAPRGAVIAGLAQALGNSYLLLGLLAGAALGGVAYYLYRRNRPQLGVPIDRFLVWRSPDDDDE